MSAVEHLLPIGQGKTRSWKQYLLDGVLAVVGTMLVTGIIAIFSLYPRIPNISIVYLLLVLALASIRGRFASIFASLVAFLSFDFFLVPPLYVFTINRVEEWIALIVFLVTAILTSQLAVTLRLRAEQSNLRERETRILYDLVRVTNREDEPEINFTLLLWLSLMCFLPGAYTTVLFFSLMLLAPYSSRRVRINPLSRLRYHRMRRL